LKTFLEETNYEDGNTLDGSYRVLDWQHFSKCSSAWPWPDAPGRGSRPWPDATRSSAWPRTNAADADSRNPYFKIKVVKLFICHS
jgi:hypothetical protein